MITAHPDVPRTDAFRILYHLRESESLTARELAQYVYGRGKARTTERSKATGILRTLEQLGLASRRTRPPTPEHPLPTDLWSLEERGERFLELVEGPDGQVAV